MGHLEMCFLSICKAFNALSPKSDNISIPIKSTSDYDLIVDAKGILSRIKVIQTQSRNEAGNYIVNLRKGIGDYEPLSISCEFLFIDSPEGYYLIPAIEITQKRAISLAGFERFKIL